MCLASGGSICASIGGGTLLIVVVCRMSHAFCFARNSIAMRRHQRRVRAAHVTDLDAGRVGENLEQRQAFLLVHGRIDDQRPFLLGGGEQRRVEPGALWRPARRRARDRATGQPRRARPAGIQSYEFHPLPWSSPEQDRPPAGGSASGAWATLIAISCWLFRRLDERYRTITKAARLTNGHIAAARAHYRLRSSASNACRRRFSSSCENCVRTTLRISTCLMMPGGLVSTSPRVGSRPNLL